MKRKSESSSSRGWREWCISSYFWHVPHSFILRLLFIKCASKFVSHLFFRLHQPKETTYFGWIFRPRVSMCCFNGIAWEAYTEKASNFIETIVRKTQIKCFVSYEAKTSFSGGNRRPLALRTPAIYNNWLFCLSPPHCAFACFIHSFVCHGKRLRGSARTHKRIRKKNPFRLWLFRSPKHTHHRTHARIRHSDIALLCFVVSHSQIDRSICVTVW